MLIVSWNVAGLSKTAHRIHDAYGPKPQGQKQAADKKATAKASVALQHYFLRHGADIMCLQEHKIPLSQLSSRSEPRSCSTVEGYESFWSCCVGKNQRGFNGVCTYAKQGMVRSANASPLGDQDLDGQGRCIMTDHGDFVLFNVYVPALGGQSLSFKMRFLNALRRAMRHQREVCKKPVMLVGDLNIAHTARDRFWKDRVVHVQDILDQVEQHKQDDEALPQWKRDLANNWAKIMAAMETKEVISTQTTNTLTREKFDKFRLCITVDSKRVFLGKHESSRDHCLWSYDFRECTYVDSETNQELVAREENVMSVGILTELMTKIARVSWNEATQRLIASTDAGVPRNSPSIQWLDDLIEQDGMVDTFRHYYPTAEGRFTCWHQLTNRRYANEGIRLDYTLVDKSLMEFVEQGDVPTLRCCGPMPEHPLGEEAALVAATANGRFQPVSFEGEGIVAASQEALDSQFGPAHTGIIYTPPSFSDHIAVSLLFKETGCSRDLVLDEKDSQTKKAQPHKSQKSIVSFLSAKKDGDACSKGKLVGTNGQSKLKANIKENDRNGIQQKQQNSFSSFFTRKRPGCDDPEKPEPALAKRQKPSSCQPRKSGTQQAKKKPASSILHHFSK